MNKNHELMYRIDVSIGEDAHESSWETTPAIYVPHAQVNEMLLRVHNYYGNWQNITVVKGERAVFVIDRTQLNKGEVPQWV